MIYRVIWSPFAEDWLDLFLSNAGERRARQTASDLHSLGTRAENVVIVFAKRLIEGETPTMFGI
jgi:hypothetical protein